MAIKPDTGEYVWHYQTTPGETWDFTATQHMILADLNLDGDQRKVIMQAPKNGFFYVIDRETGEFISASNFVPTNWATHIDVESGRPVEVPDARYPGKKPYFQLPGPIGAHNWHPMAFNPQTKLVYIPAQEIPFVYSEDPDYNYEVGKWNTGANLALATLPTDAATFKAVRAMFKGRIIAWDPVKQEAAWTFEHKAPWNGGLLSTAGGLVFQGTADAHFAAYDASSGEQLWKFFSQTGIVAAPISYSVDGEQYIAVASGWGGSFALAYGGVTAIGGAPKAGRVLTFKLGAAAQLPELSDAVVATPPLPPSTAPENVIAKGGKPTCSSVRYVTAITACHTAPFQACASHRILAPQPGGTALFEKVPALTGAWGNFSQFLDEETSESNSRRTSFRKPTANVARHFYKEASGAN